MRLTESERSIIKRLTVEIFGESSRVFLFGSRVDDDKKGGDIDLFIEAKTIYDLFDQKIKLLTQLQAAIGDQKIDIIIATDSTRPIEQEARRTGILL